MMMMIMLEEESYVESLYVEINSTFEIGVIKLPRTDINDDMKN